MQTKQPITNAMWQAAHAANGEPLGNGPMCATCGMLAVLGRHPAACERDRRGRLMVWAEAPATAAARTLGRLGGQATARKPLTEAQRAARRANAAKASEALEAKRAKE